MIRAGTADTTIKVAPLVGAWIEIKGGYIIPEPEPRRSSCRSVD